jgi:hypothetical protein
MNVAALVKAWQEGLIGEAEFIARLNKLDLALFAHGKMLHYTSDGASWNVIDSNKVGGMAIDFVVNDKLPADVAAVFMQSGKPVGVIKS